MAIASDRNCTNAFRVLVRTEQVVAAMASWAKVAPAPFLLYGNAAGCDTAGCFTDRCFSGASGPSGECLPIHDISTRRKQPRR